MSRTMSRFLNVVGIGLLVVGNAAGWVRAPAQPPKGDDRPPVGGLGLGVMASPAQLWGMLVRSEKVRKELQLTDEQAATLRATMDRAAAKLRQSRPTFETLRDLSAEERKAKFAESARRAWRQAEETRKEIEGILLPHQAERLGQIVLQVRGTAALEHKDFQDTLGLTGTQRREIAALRAEMNEKVRGIFRSDEKKGRGAKFQALRKEIEGKMLDVLTPEQKQKWETLKGAKFEVDWRELMSPSRSGGGKKSRPSDG